MPQLIAPGADTVDPSLADEVTQRASEHFEAYRQLERANRFDEAFAELALANDIKGAALPLATRDVFTAERAVAEARTAFDAETLNAAPRGKQAVAPIFIIGMPRSGSTLIEQILASHPSAQPMGETTALTQALAPTVQYGGMEWFDGDRVARRYLEQVRAQGWDGRSTIIDKALFNHMHVGAITLAFPNARIVHATRDPMDTCFSCYRTLFGNDELLSFTYSLANLARRYRSYRAFMGHWSFALMGQLFTLKNEDLVADQEGQTRRLLHACGLPWDERCLRFWETERPIDTVSADQVRQPIFADSLGRWRRYERHLQPLVQGLGAAARP